MRETILAALIAHFKSVIEANAAMPFAETGVALPTKSFEGYADTITAALGGDVPIYSIKME